MFIEAFFCSRVYAGELHLTKQAAFGCLLAPARIMSGYGDIQQSPGRADSAMLIQFGANPLYQPVNRTRIIQKIINTSADS